MEANLIEIDLICKNTGQGQHSFIQASLPRFKDSIREHNPALRTDLQKGMQGRM
jgi:hypothetical protein